MKKRCVVTALALCCAFQSCEILPEVPIEQEQEPEPEPEQEPGTTVTATAYTIKKGSHYADQNIFKMLNTDHMRFSVTFDSTAVYTTADPANQGDMNKLYGLSDCKSHHHTNSVRFGWRWYNNRLEMHAYTYKNKERNSAFIGYVTLGSPSVCEIKLENQAYVLTMDGNSVSLPRACDGKGEGYQLYPYFGGDEVAPHDVTITIQELPDGTT